MIVAAPLAAPQSRIATTRAGADSVFTGSVITFTRGGTRFVRFSIWQTTFGKIRPVHARAAPEDLVRRPVVGFISSWARS